MTDAPRVLVVGSINMDLVVRARQMPSPGQTVLGDGFVANPGGKGANQAVAAARLGASCRLVGRVGKDSFGQTVLDNLAANGVDCQAVGRTGEAATGVAMVIVDAMGENAIVVDSGANEFLTPDDVFAQEKLFGWAQIVLLQLELPVPTVRAAIDLARRNRCQVLLDPAPAQANLPEAIWQVDIVSPNIIEAEMITGAKTDAERGNRNVALDLLARGAKAVVLKLGARGCLVVVADGHFYRVEPFKVDIVDTTGAGDAFSGALAVAVTQGFSLHESARFANAAGALACTRLGAQAAMPTAQEVRLLLEDRPN